MPLLTPDPMFYPSARMVMQARPETPAYMALINPTRQIERTHRSSKSGGDRG